jgi:two-component system cell cycle response regulator
MKVLVAHRSPDVRASLRAALEQIEAHVVEVEEPEAALAACREEEPAVTLIELGMERSDGVSLLPAIKCDPDLFRTSIIVVDSELDPDTTLEALSGGAEDVLREPPVAAEVIARVRAAERATALRAQLLERERGLEELAFSDELTRLYNRRFLTRQLSALIRSATRHERAISVVLVDIDRFKAINDTYGHARGDAVLTRVAARLQRCLREEDYAGRWGGEEFLILLPDDGEAGAQVAAEKLRAAVGNRPVAGLPVTVSAGCATWLPGESIDDVLRRADGALYDAKRAGRDQVVVAA